MYSCFFIIDFSKNRYLYDHHGKTVEDIGKSFFAFDIKINFLNAEVLST